jgi:MFS family permease
MLSIGATALWSFTERMGISIGIDLATIGQIFAGSILVGLVGASSAALIGQKLGSFWPVIVSSSIAVLAAVSMPQVNSAVAFIVIFCILQLSQQFSDPFKVGVIARLDTEGRLMGLTAGTGLLGAAFGPFLAGVIVEDGGFHRLSYLYLGLAALSYAAFWPLLRRDQAR